MSIFDAPSSSSSLYHHEDPHHRPIELQSPSDLTYLSNAISLHTQSLLHTHLPPQSSPSSTTTTTTTTTTPPPPPTDPLRLRVQSLLDTYISNVLSLTKPNLSINGLRGEEMEESLQSEEQIEDFDGGLAGRIQGLSAEIEGLRGELAELRRTRPGDLRREWEGREGQREDGEDGEDGEDREGWWEGEVGVSEIQRLDGIQGDFERGVRELERVKGGIGGTGEKLERARRGLESVLGSAKG